MVFKFVWFSPMILPIEIDIIIIVIIKYVELLVYIIKIMGAIFWVVNKIMFCCQFNLIITWGTQKWRGAAPIFINNDEFIIVKIDKFISLVKLFIVIKIITENNRAEEAKAWTRKYFIEDSEENGLLFLLISGINLIKLISNPIHVLIHEYDEIEIIVPDIIVAKKIIL